MGWEEHAIFLDENGRVPQRKDDDWAVTRELKRSIGQTPALLGSAIEGIGAAIPGEFVDPVTEGISRGLTEYSASLTEGIAPNPVPSFEEIIPEGKTFIEAPIESISRGLTYAGGATGQGIGSLVAQGLGMASGAAVGGIGGLVVGGPAGAAVGATGGAIAGRGASSFGQNYGEIFQALREEAPLYNEAHPDAPISAEELGQAALIPGIGAAAIDYISFGRLMPVLKDAEKFVGLSPKQAAKEIMKSYAKGFATEAPAEGTQEAIKVATSTGTFDREATPEEKASIIDAAIMGGLGGGVVGAAGQAIPVVSGMARKEPTRDDLAAAMSGESPLSSEPLTSTPEAVSPIEPIPQEQFDPVTGEVVLNRDDLATAMEQGVTMPTAEEDLQTSLTSIENQAKQSGWNRVLLAKREEIEGKISDMKKQEVDLAASQATPDPTEAQKDAGNYKKGHTNISGLDISIENEKGSIRSGVDGDGESWQTVMPAHYGYVKRTEGADGDHVDVYIGDNPDAQEVFVVDQIDPLTGDFDEHKAMVGFDNLGQAMAAYEAGFSDGTGSLRAGSVTPMIVDNFKNWLKKGNTKKPLSYRKPVADTGIPFDYPQAKGVTQKPIETAIPENGVTPENKNPVTLPTLTEQTPAQPEIKRGTVGMKLAGGESVTTNTGRTTSPFPTIALGSPRRANLTVENVKKWLMQNALDEAMARGDEFNARQFEANLKRASQADLDSAEAYLFDPAFVFDNPPSILKPLSTPETEQETEYVAPQQPENSTEPAENIDMKPNTVSEETNSSKDSPAPEAQKEIGSEPETSQEQSPQITPDADTKVSSVKGSATKHGFYEALKKSGKDKTLYVFSPDEAREIITELKQKNSDQWGHGTGATVNVHKYYAKVEDGISLSVQDGIGKKIVYGEGIEEFLFGTGEVISKPETTTQEQTVSKEETVQVSAENAQTENNQVQEEKPKPPRREKQEKTPEQPKADRGRKMQDVGEKLEGKRALQEKLGKASYPEKAKEIIEATRPKNAFKFQQRDGQTSGVARFAQKLQDNLYDYSEYLKSRGTISRSRSRYSKVYGWEQQLANIFADGADLNGADIGPRNSISEGIVVDYRQKIIESAEEYVELASRLNDMFENADNIEQFKAELSNAFEDGDFKSLFDKYAKTYGLKSDIFSDSYYSPFAKITDESEVQKPNRVEKTLTRPKLEKIERIGLKDRRNGRDVSEREFMDTFGFRGVEFGEWVSSKDGQSHVNLAFDALYDLADRIGINPKHISLGGNLGFAFGSRGKGEHSAHFEPMNNVINLTKTRGDGAVAHEWLHALDHNLRQSGREGVQFMNSAYKSMSRKPIDDAQAKVENRLKDFLKGTAFWQRGSRKMKMGVVGEAKYTIEQYAQRPFEYLFSATDFSKEGKDLGSYWGSEIELIARAWEGYIYDTLGGTNPYLVNDWVSDGAVSKENGYRGTIYPTGEERQRFAKIFDKLIESVEFSDSGVKVKEGATLPIADEAATMIDMVKSFEPKLNDMLKEIENGSVQQTQVQTSVPDGDGGASTGDVPGAATDEDIEHLFGRDRARGPSDVQENGGTLDEGKRDRAGRGGNDRSGDRIQRDDTVLEQPSERPPEFSAQGVNHKIPVGALDEKRGHKQKAKDNLEIIRTVKMIESENRAATQEEQTLLAKFTGWGSLKNAFPKGDGKTIEKGWEDINSSLKSLLTENEYKEARKSIQFAHYTSEIVVRSMWTALHKFGLKHGNVFEPGMGIGNFTGMIPDGMNIEYAGLELDPMTHRIARILYPQASIRNADFISARYGDNTFDAAIGNPPFADTKITADPKYRSKALSLHNYFFAKTIDMLAPGGVMAFVTSRYSMDAMDSSARKFFAEKADLVGAIRLPNTAFKTNANTEVVTDIIFLRKRLKGEESNGTKWIETRGMPIESESGEIVNIPVNEYFHDHPEMILGNVSLTGTMHSKNEFTVEPSEASDLQVELAEAISRLPENIITDIQKSETQGIDFTPIETKEGAYYLKDGTLMQVSDGVGAPVSIRGKGTGGMASADVEKIKMLVPVKLSLRKAMDAMIRRDDAEMKSAQKDLSKQYEAFVKKYGPITKSESETRAATVGDVEEARNELRQDYLEAGEEFNEGDINLSHLIGKVNPETGKKYTNSQIGAMRKKMREEMEAKGQTVDEGDFNPADVPPNVIIRYPNLDLFMDDPEAYDLMILENYNEETGIASRTDVFSKNIVADVKKPELKTSVDSLNYSLMKLNRVDIDFMSSELGKNKDEIIAELEDLDLIYRLPNAETSENVFVYSEEYLSGFVKDKLAYAKKLAEFDSIYKRNVLALEAVQPKDIPASDINTQLGSPYFDEAVIRDFMRDALNISAKVTRVQSVNSWDVSSQDRYSPENTTQWGTEKRNATDLVESMLMRRNIQVTNKNEDGSQVVNIAETQAAQDKARLIQEKFSDWIWKSSHSERIFRKYNDEFNNVVPRKYNGEHITTSISPSIKLRPHQKSVIWRIMQSGNTHMAHGVGAGKTLAMASAAMEMRRLGNWRKPMIVVPNHMLAQFAGEFKLAYPQARILIADKKKTDKDHRQKFVALAAKGDYDAIVIPFSAFSKISVSKGFDAKMMDAQVSKYRMALEETNRVSGKRSGTAAQLEKQIQKMEQRIAKLKNAEVDEAFYFEQLGVDALIVDEAHYFRKLSFPTNQGNVKGVSPVGSKAAWDLYAKTRYLDTIHPGRNLVMASGTPLTNTLAEVFTLQRFMDERSLVQRGLDSFDSWSATFAASVSAPERQPSGSYKTVTRLSEFRNLGTLSPMVRSFMDVVTSEELASLVDRPTLKSGSMIIKTTKPSTAYLAFQKYLEHRTQAIAGKRSNEKGADNILSIIGEGRQAAVDMRMIDPTLPEEPSKLTDMVENVLKIWKETSGDTFKNKYSGDDKISPNKGGAQLIFSDLGVNGKSKNGVSFSAYSYIRRTLVNKGVPAKQIAFISDYETEDDKRRLQNMVKNGEIRILIGSTAKMGTGLNVQNRLKAVHNLDAPWLPADLEQRSGRVLRQGNQYKEVEIYGYGTEGSYDSTMWGMLETKAKAIISFLKGDSDVSSMRDIEETDMFRIAKAMTSGDPRVLKQAELQSEVERLGRQSRNFTNEQVKIKSDLARKNSGIERAKQQISNIEAANKKAVKPEEGKFLMTVSGKPYTERAEAAGALDAAIASVMSQNINTASDGVKIGSLYGFDVNFFMSVANLATKYEIFLDHPAFSEQSQTWTTLDNETFSPSGAITRLINSINRLDKAKENEQRIIEMNTREIGVLDSQQTGEFPKQKEYESKKAELAQIDKDLQENAPVEVTYDQYPVEYWEENKSAISRTSFSIVGDDEFRIDRSTVRPGKRAKIMRALERAAKKMNIPLDSIELFSDVKDVLNIPNVDNAIEDGRVEGFYYKNLIYIAMTADDPVSTLTHEVVHKLKAAKAFTDAEWKYLTSHAAEWRTKYQIEKHYSKLKDMTEAKMDEEAIAHAVQDYANKGFLERVRNRLKMWFNMIRSVLTGDDFKFSSPEEVFEAILEGQISKRKFSTDTSAMAMFQSISETVSELEDRLVKRYGIKLSLTGKSPVTISMIKVEESQRRNGVAKAVIQEITDWADKTGSVLSLTPTDEYGIRKSVLERFYERNGFVSNSGRNKDFSISESMIRLPIKSTPDVKNDAAMFSLFGNVIGKKLTKRDQLNAAIDALGIENTDKKLRPALSLISSYILHPRQIAALYDKFAPVFMEVTKMMQRRDKIVHELTVLMSPYNHLTLEHKKRVNAVLELGRLKKENFAVKDGMVTAHNVGLSDAVFSNPGEDITLDEMETKAYLGARKAMDKALDIYEQTILEEYGYLAAGIDSVEKLEYLIENTPDDTVRGHMEEALDLLYQIEEAKRTGYIPLKRWGEIGITVRSKTEMVEDENGEEKPKLLHFERVELPKLRKNKILENADVLEAIKKLRDKYGDSVDIDYFEVKDFATLRTKLNLAELDVLAASSDMSREEYDALREALGDAMKRKGFKAHFFKSEDVPGYSDDFERALNDYIVSISGHLSRKMHETPIADKMKEIADSGQERLFEYAKKYVTYVTDPVEEFRALRQINFMWYLAGNIASGVTNASQPFMVTAPWFRAMFSHGDIFKQMTRAYKETASMLSIKAGLDVFDFDKAPADVREILKLADEDGMFIPLQTHDAMAIAYSSSTNLRGIGRKMRTAQDALALTFTIPERTNRVVTYISAYRFAIDPKNKDGIMRFVGTDALARAELAGKSGREFAMAFAEYAVYSTQLQMGRLNRPTLSRGIGTLPFQFMSFSMQIMELMYRLTKIHGGKSGTTLAIMLLAVVAMSGIKGFPFEDDVQAMIEAAYKRLTLVDLDIDTEMKGILTDAVGEKMAHAIMYGVPAALLNVDMSARLGYGNLVPDDQSDMLGIWWDMLYTRPTNAITSLSRGDVLQAFADISPAILKNPLQAFIWSQDGVKSASTGDTVITADDLTDADIGLKALGFTSGSISKERQRIFAQRRANMAVNDLRSVYYDKLARAYAGMILASREGDMEKKDLYLLEIQAISEEKEAYNKDAPIYKKIIIHQPSLKKRIAEELLGAKANKPRKQARAQAQKIDEIYGK